MIENIHKYIARQSETGNVYIPKYNTNYGKCVFQCMPIPLSFKMNFKIINNGKKPTKLQTYRSWMPEIDELSTWKKTIPMSKVMYSGKKYCNKK